MKLRKAKNEAEALAAMRADLKPGRARVEFTTKDGAFTGLRIGQLHVGFGQYGSSLELSTEQLFDPASRYKVVATVQGFPTVTTYHEDYADAVAKRNSYGDGATVECGTDRVDVLVDEHGQVVCELPTEPVAEVANTAAEMAAEIPF